ncbi:ubiquitin-like-specific protease 1D isoform X2 [Momordica charantia]|uniref:Ubiquitin-like-specific protease 1D isoform X2 n=1 Tax=Momordica charantia TaxID=3673 RepID=A0A6J1DAG0_MOMCH|nr:ubiquitin-like-specific protease 1D isoform X2 [Momordica charantia]
MEQEKTTKRPLNIDWDKLLGCEDEEPPPDVVIEPPTAAPHPQNHLDMDSDRQHLAREEYQKFSDVELEDKIRRMKSFYETKACKLPDKGQKYIRTLELCEEEREYRKLRRVEKEATGCENLSQPTTSSMVGTSYGAREKTASSSADSLSTFTSCFSRKLEEKAGCNNGSFSQELSVLGHCDNRRQRYNGRLSPKLKQKGQTSSRQQPFKSANNLSFDVHKNGKNSDQFDFDVIEKLPGCFGKKDASQVQHSDNLRLRETIVVVDEEEALAIKISERDDKCMKETKIYYPSRHDPESVEICFEDIKCLDPEGYLTSTIMNFYIRYLQQRACSTNRVICNSHFFNTYFYEKLKEAVSNKGKDKEIFFVKFRRWWKGVNIFQKAYVLIPIHEDLHWSLVIICFPHKEDEAGPIILHLDSLGLHSSRSIFDNIKNYIKEEWCYLDREVSDSDLPMPFRIWKNISRRIEDKIIEVPQQKNDYDCGLFVLYFIERFIEEAPDRLKRKDLDMFGKRWFKPQEASGLRTRIRSLLKMEFQIVKRQCLSGSVEKISSSDQPPKQ